ncbi:hypothetical protein Avbf_12762 [Armadillidium vulgare]|nr:hypothetical protein Avbf_12762 [Armadillidium vulgare]
MHKLNRVTILSIELKLQSVFLSIKCDLHYVKYSKLDLNNFDVLIIKGNGVLLQGPRRLMKLCLFGLILPVMLISIPLYVRLILYPPFQYVMAPTDQRSLEKTSSSVWCQGQTVQMNGSFNAYLVPEAPRKKLNYSIHTMLQHVVLKDDVKEYWGFFLQKGSIVNINLCTS